MIDILRKNDNASAWFKRLEERAIVSAISFLELYAGIRSQREERDTRLLLRHVRCLPVTEDIAESAGFVLRHYGASHSLDLPDAIIAATAEHHRLELATLNTKHFPMFPKLKRPY